MATGCGLMVGALPEQGGAFFRVEEVGGHGKGAKVFGQVQGFVEFVLQKVGGCQFALEFLARAAFQLAECIGGDAWIIHGVAGSEVSRVQRRRRVWIAPGNCTPTFEALIFMASPISL